MWNNLKYDDIQHKYFFMLFLVHLSLDVAWSACCFRRCLVTWYRYCFYSGSLVTRFLLNYVMSPSALSHVSFTTTSSSTLALPSWYSMLSDQSLGSNFKKLVDMPSNEKNVHESGPTKSFIWVLSVILGVFWSAFKFVTILIFKRARAMLFLSASESLLLNRAKTHNLSEIYHRW